MTTAAEMLRRFQKVDLTEIMGEVVMSNPDQILDLNKGQLESGVDKKGARLSKYRSNSYAVLKNNQNPRPGFGNPDLKRTGAFHASFVVDVRGDDVVFSAGDSKAPALEAKYGSAIFGLTEDSKADYRPELVQGAAKKAKERTGCI